MSVPLFYSTLPVKNDGTPDLELLSDLFTQEPGANGESLCLVSYFPKELRYSSVSPFVINKCILFVHNPHGNSDYEISWSIKIFQGNTEITNQFLIELPTLTVPNELLFKITEESPNISLTPSPTIKIEATVSNGNNPDKILIVEHDLKQVESDFYSDPAQNPNAQNEKGVYLGNEAVTHFVSGHLREYLSKAKIAAEAIDDGGEVFGNLTASIVYNNCLKRYKAINGYAWGIGFNGTFEDYIYEYNIDHPQSNSGELEARSIGICDLDLVNLNSISQVANPVRLENLTKRNEAVYNLFNSNFNDFIKLYHIATFPKSAINKSIEVFKHIFDRFKADAIPDTKKIYETFTVVALEQKNQITEWKANNYFDTKDNDNLLKNILTEYKYGPLTVVSKDLISSANPGPVLSIDWSPFILKLLMPASSAYVFTLVKLQVLDLRSGNPIKNTLISQLEFNSFTLNGPNNTSISDTFRYKIEKPYTAGLPIESADSKIKKVQKILKAMGYYTGNLSDALTNPVKTAIVAYFNDSDRFYDRYMTVPTVVADISNASKVAPWLQFIIEDFSHHCITDEEGILYCRIPSALLEDRKLDINVGFGQFAIIRERLASEEGLANNLKPLKRDRLNAPKRTNFRAAWKGSPAAGGAPNPNEQNLDWTQTLGANKNFGWEISNRTGNNTDFLKVGLKLHVKLNESTAFNTTTNHLSTHFSDTNDIHFVLFGMQWCQPVWNPVPITATHKIKGKIEIDDGFPHALNRTFPNNERFLPIMVSVPTGSGSGQGRDYGMLVPRRANAVNENNIRVSNAQAIAYLNTPEVVLETYRAPNEIVTSPRSNRHAGVDYLAVDGVSPVFTPHFGKIVVLMGTPTAISGSGGYGVTRVVAFSRISGEEYRFRFAHLHGAHPRSAGNPDTNMPTFKINDYVMAGTKIGHAGRTYFEQHTVNAAQGRYYKSGATHLHFEICRNSNTRRVVNPLSIFNNFSDERENNIIFLNNDSDRAFPCDCHWPTASNSNAARCSIRDNLGIPLADRKTSISTACWASTNLHCPYMRPTNWATKTAARKNELNIFRIQSQLTYLYEDDSNRLANGNVDPAGYRSPNGIDGGWGAGTEAAIKRFRELHQATIYPIAANVPAAGDAAWEAQPVADGPALINGDATWIELNTQAPYERINLNRVDK